MDIAVDTDTLHNTYFSRRRPMTSPMLLQTRMNQLLQQLMQLQTVLLLPPSVDRATCYKGLTLDMKEGLDELYDAYLAMWDQAEPS